MFEQISFALIYSRLGEWRRDDQGASLAEYGLLLGLMVVAIAATAGALGGAIGDVFTATGGAIAPDGG